jgi:demethylspheroidene O-methyltransferase
MLGSDVPSMTPAARWHDRFAAWRNRLLASPGFRRWALKFPLTRPIARHHADALFDLCAGFAYSQVLAACVRLDLFAALANGPQPVAALAAATRLPPPAVRRLAYAATSLGLLEIRADRVGLGSLGAVVLGSPDVQAMIEHHALLYADLADPVALLREPRAATRLRRYWAYATTDAVASLGVADTQQYSRLMTTSQELIAAEVVDAYRVERHRRWLDVGGGEGAFVLALAARAPQLRGSLFDVPAVAAVARTRLAACGVAGRFAAIGGDMFSDALPRGHDVVSLIRVLHDHDDARALELLEAARAALEPGGTLLIAEPLATDARRDRVAEAYFGLYLWAMGQGRLRTRAELGALVRRAGFGPPALLKTRSARLVRVLVTRAATKA